MSFKAARSVPLRCFECLSSNSPVLEFSVGKVRTLCELRQKTSDAVMFFTGSGKVIADGLIQFLGAVTMVRWVISLYGMLTGLLMAASIAVAGPVSISEYYPLVNGQSVRLTVPHGTYASDHAQLPYFALELPDRDNNYALSIASHVVDKGLFLPSLVFLDGSRKPIRSVSAVGVVRKEGMSRLVSRKDIPVPNGARYVIVTTTNQQLEQSLSYSEKITAPIVIPASSAVVAVPVGESKFQFSASLQPHLEITMPANGRNKSVQRLTGWYLGLGSAFKEESIANNPNGDNYGAGSGGMILLGRSMPLAFSTTQVNVRLAGGIRYQGGDGENIGFIAQGIVLKLFGSISVGAGLHIDSGGSVTNTAGFKRSLKPVIVPKLYLDWSTTEKLSLGATLIGANEYEDKATGDVFSGPKFGVYANWGF